MIAWPDLAAIIGVALAAGLAGAVLGWAALRGLRARSIRVALTIVALTAVIVIGTAVVAVGALMLVSGHALAVLITAVLAGGLAGLAVAAALARSVVRSSAGLHEAVGRLGRGDPPAAHASAGVAAAELATLAADLDRAHRSITEARARERVLEDSRRELVAWVSHDLRTPLAGLRAMTEALEDGVVADAPTMRAYHQQIRVEVERLAVMIDDLFELSRINAGALRLTLSTVDLGVLVTEAVAASAPIAGRRGVRVLADTRDASSTIADPDQMDRALRNLIVNAIRHTPSDGTVTVRTSGDADEAVLSVRDQCGGIPQDDLPRIFDVGFRGSRARSPGDGLGAGLGLAIAQGIVTAHHGSVAVDNIPGGCRFEIRLPGDSSSLPRG